MVSAHGSSSNSNPAFFGNPLHDAEQLLSIGGRRSIYVLMGDKPPRTLLDLAKVEADAAVRCGGCNRTVILQPRVLALRFGFLGMVEPVAKLATRLKCHSCNHRGARIEQFHTMLPSPRFDNDITVET